MVVVRFVSALRSRKPVLRYKNPVLRKQEEPVLRKQKPRTRKRIRDEDAGLRTDFISRLSDDVLHQILSSLPTKDLVRTSALSTRWCKVWTFFPVIDINLSEDEMYEWRDGFLDVMERKMLNPSSVRIRKFCLKLTYTPTAGASDILLWVDEVMEHKVQEFDLALPKKMVYRLPDQLFSSNSLTKLKLEMECELTIPEFVCFPRLKVLRLSGLKFSTVRSTEILFSSCPVLEELDLSDCNWGGISSIVIYNPSLQKFFITYSYLVRSPDTKITVSAPNLVYFRCRSQEPMDLVLCDQSSLEFASIDVSNKRSSNPESSLQRTVKLLHGTQGVKALFLSSYALKTLSFEKDLHAILPSFDNLKELDVVCPSNECCSRALIDILRKTPHLNFLKLDSVIEPYDGFYKEDCDLNVIPQCFKTSLKRIDLNLLRGNIAEVRFLKYILGNATLLEKMLIDRSYLSADRKKEIRNELESSRVAATNCEIELCPILSGYLF